MTNEANFEGATLELLAFLKEKKKNLEEKHATELADIDREIEAVSITMRLLREKQETPTRETVFKPSVIPNTLNGLSARAACIEIARCNSGIVRVADAKNALVSARILKPTKNTWAIVYTTLQRSKEFEKFASGGPGVFRLIDSVPLKERQQQSLLQ